MKVILKNKRNSINKVAHVIQENEKNYLVVFLPVGSRADLVYKNWIYCTGDITSKKSAIENISNYIN